MSYHPVTLHVRLPQDLCELPSADPLPVPCLAYLTDDIPCLIECDSLLLGRQLQCTSEVLV